MYVNFSDRHQRVDGEKPTSGIVLCSDKNDAMVRVTLPEDVEQIHASRYQLYLPTEESSAKSRSPSVSASSRLGAWRALTRGATRERARAHPRRRPPGVGKTMLIGRLLASNRSKLLMAARGIVDDALMRATESTSRTKTELAASADHVKDELNVVVSRALANLSSKAIEGSQRTLELAAWAHLLAIGKVLLAYAFTLRCLRSTEADVEHRGLTLGDVDFRADVSYQATLTTTVGPVTFPMCAYRDYSRPLPVTRTPARSAANRNSGSNPTSPLGSMTLLLRLRNERPTAPRRLHDRSMDHTRSSSLPRRRTRAIITNTSRNMRPSSSCRTAGRSTRIRPMSPASRAVAHELHVP